MSSSTVATTPVILDVATCRPKTWMQQITEGQTNEPAREEDSDESNPS